MPKLVSTGQITLTDVTDGLYARLSSESHVVPTNTDGSDGTYDGCSTTMSILLGRTDDSANWSVTASATVGVIGELVGKTYTVSNMTVDAGYVDITATRVGYPALTSRFSITKARRGFAGPAITLIASKQGFSFVDGIAEPADQSIAFTVVRHNATEPVVFYATGDASLVSDDGRLTLMNYALGVPGVGNGDTAYLDLAQFGNNRQVTITAVCGDLNATQTVVRLDQSSAAAGATRNVHRGNWTSNTPYQLGDTVIYQGYGWSCTTAHTSSVVVTPPVYPVGFNDNWTLASVKGADSKSAYLTSSSYVFRIAQDGTVSPASIALTAVGQNITGEPTFQVQTGTATLSGSGGVARTLTAANLTSEQATIKITWDGLEDFVTVTKIREGSNGITVVSSNEAHVLPADKDGAVTSYANSGTTIQVFEGSAALNASSSATVSAFRVGTITQSPSSTITVGTVSYAGTTATIPNHSAMANGTDSVVLTIPVTVYRADGSSIVVNKIQTISKSKTGATGATGTDALTIVVSNEAHTLPASNTGVVSSYTNSGTTIQVFEGVTALNAVSSIAGNSQFTIGTPVLSPAASITVGNRTYSSTTATVAQHSMMLDATDSILITYPVSIRRSNGANVTINCSQTITKSKAGAQGTQGIQGVKGDDGITHYTWVKYADSPTTGMSDFPDGKLYLGVAYNKTTAVESTTYADYSWSLIKGSDGVQGPKGDDGVTTYTWIKYADTSSGAGMSDSPTGKTYIGIAPNKTSPTESTTAGDYTWSLIQGPKGDQGPAVVVNSSRALSFTATDGTLDASQLDIVLTASVSGVASPTYAWAFSGLQTNPTASVTDSQTITAAQFGTSKSAIVTCTVNGTYVDKVTIVRLEKSTAAPYATTGSNLAAPFDSWNLLGQSLATITDGKVGSTSLRLTSAAGAYPIQRNFIPIDPTKKYRAKFWARPSADCNGSLYFNLRQAITTAPSWGPTNGGRHPYQPSAITRAAHNSTFGGTDQWGEYSYIWDSTQWQTGVKFFVPEFLNNYQGSTGYWEIQDVVVEEVTAVEAAKTLATAAAAAAAEAQLDADAANAMLTDIASDSKLAPVEKKQVKLEWDSLVAEKAGINAQATLFGITTENTSYNNNYTTLSGYLSSLLSDLSTPSTIVGSTFRLNFTNFYSARQELLNKISVEASKRADWELVTGANKPENGATRNNIFVQTDVPTTPGTGDIWQNSLNEVPSLDLRFDLDQLDPRITFARTSEATYYDGKTIVKAEENLLQYSQDFASIWNKGRVTVTADQAVAPDGTNTADKIVETTEGTSHVVFQMGLNANVTYAFSVYCKANGRSVVGISNSSNGVGRAQFNISTGTVLPSATGAVIIASPAITSVGDGWYRISCIITSPITSSIAIFLQNSDTNISYTGDGVSGIYIWGAQLEQRSQVTTYTPTTTQAITKYQPALRTAAAGSPRFDHDPLTGESLGLLIEEQRTNLLLRSDILVPSYSGSGLSFESAVGPTSEVVTWAKLKANAVGGAWCYTTYSYATSTAYTLSVFVKSLDGNPPAFGSSSGTSAANSFALVVFGTAIDPLSYKVQSLGNGVYRVHASITSPATIPNINTGIAKYQGNDSRTFMFTGFQLEVGAFPTSYIRTEATAVTRAADNVAMTGETFSSWYRADEGTFFSESNCTAEPAVSMIRPILRTLPDGISFSKFNGGTSSYYAYFAGSIDTGTFRPNTIKNSKDAFAFKAGQDPSLAINDTVQTTKTSGAASSVVAQPTEIRIGSNNVSNYFSGYIKRIAYYPKRLTNDALKAITTGVHPGSIAKWTGSEWKVISDIDTARGMAAYAQRDADSANTLLKEISSDNKLTPVEKQQTKLEWDALVAEKSGIDAQADSYSITTEKTAYGAAYTTLSTYLTPLLSSLTTTSDIDGAAFRGTFTTFYSARQALLNRISAVAGTRADYLLVSNKPEADGFLETFESGNLSQWTNYTGSGELSVVSVSDSLTGGKVLRIGNNSGNDTRWLIHNQNIPFDPSALYRIKFRVRQIAGTGEMYLGLAGVAADGVTLINNSGATGHSSQHYVAAVAQKPGATWVEYVGYVKGTGAAGQTATNPPITTPLKLHQNVKYIRPLIIANYQNLAGITEVDYCSIERLTDAVNWEAISGTNKPENGATVGAPAGTLVAGTEASTVVTNASTALTNASNAQIAADSANNKLADIAADNKLTPVEKKAIRAEWDAAYAEYAGIITQATAFGVTAEKTSYDNAIKALGTYLNNAVTYTLGTTPPNWIIDANLSVTTTIVGATFRSNWSTLHSTRQALLNKIAEVAATKADWSTITGSGKPENGATKNTIYRQSTTPSGGTNGDIWVDTSITPNVQKVLVGGTWQISSTVGASFDNTSPSAIQGQITSSNVSVWIGTAAIGAAQIGSIQLIGNFNVKSAVSGERMEMDSQSIKVYDSTRLRVQLGNLDV